MRRRGFGLIVMEIASSLANGLTIAMALFLSATGLTVLFGILRILNFAQGTFILIGAYVASLILGHSTFGISTFLGAAMVAGIVVALLGILVDKLIFHRLRYVDESSALIATFALMLVMQGVIELIWGRDVVSVDPPAGLDGAMVFGRLVIPQYSVFLIVMGLLVFLVLEVVIGRLWFGKVLESVARDPWMMAIMGYDVSKLISLAVMLSFFLAGFGGGLLAPNQTLQPHMGGALILQAFAVVIIGGLGSVRGAFLASILLGLAESFGARIMPSLALYVGMVTILLIRPQGLLASASSQPARVWSWLPKRRTSRTAHPAAIAVRLARPRAVPSTARVSQERRAVTLPVFIATAAVALLASLPWWGTPGAIYVASFVLVEAVFALSWNMMFGLTGLATFGHAAFFAIGAYLVAFVLKGGFLMPFPALLLGAGVLGVLIAIPVGAITVRRSGGLQLAILTLALSEVFRVLVSYSESLGRDEGIAAIPRPTLALMGLVVPLKSDGAYFTFLLVACGLLVAFMWWLAHGEFGRVLRSIHQDPERAAFIGIDVNRYRFLVFVLASATAAVAGGLSAPLTQIVSPETAGVAKSTAPMLNTLLGGAASFWGPVLGAAAYSAIQYATRTMGGLSEVVMGVMLLAVILASPDGIAGFISKAFRMTTSRTRPSVDKGAEAPS